jgi:hypothetical protein
VASDASSGWKAAARTARDIVPLDVGSVPRMRKIWVEQVISSVAGFQNQLPIRPIRCASSSSCVDRLSSA